MRSPCAVAQGAFFVSRAEIQMPALAELVVDAGARVHRALADQQRPRALGKVARDRVLDGHHLSLHGGLLPAVDDLLLDHLVGILRGRGSGCEQDQHVLYMEIATDLGLLQVPEGTIKARLSRARTMLKESYIRMQPKEPDLRKPSQE